MVLCQGHLGCVCRAHPYGYADFEVFCVILTKLNFVLNDIICFCVSVK